MELVPDTDRLVTPVIAPLKTALPVIVNEFVPPAMVELLVTVEPCRVLVALVPVKVTAPLYCWVPVVVMLAAILVPELWLEVVCKLVNGVPPTTPLKVMLPTPASTANAFAPATVLLKLMLLPVEDAPVEARLTELPSVTAPV